MAIIAPSDQCGEVCDQVLDVLGRAEVAAQGTVRFGYAYWNEPMADPLTGEETTFAKAYKLVNEEKGSVAIPSLIMYPYGPKGISTTVNFGSDTTNTILSAGPRGVYSSMQTFIPSFITLLTTANVDSFLGEASPARPASGVPNGNPLQHVLVVSERPTPSIVAKRLSLDLFDRATFGYIRTSFKPVLDAFEGVVEEPFPAIYVSKPTNKTDVSTPQDLEWERFPDESPSFIAVRGWLEDRLLPVSVPEVRARPDFDRICTRAGGVCFLALLPGDAEARADPSAAFNAAALRRYMKLDPQSLPRGQAVADRLPVRFAWVNTYNHEELLGLFDVAEIPAVVAVNPRSKRFVTLRSAFDVDQIHQFILRVMEGSEPFEKLEELPSFDGQGSSGVGAAPRAARKTAAEDAGAPAEDAAVVDDASPEADEVLKELLSQFEVEAKGKTKSSKKGKPTPAPTPQAARKVVSDAGMPAAPAKEGEADAAKESSSSSKGKGSKGKSDKGKSDKGKKGKKGGK